MLELLRTPGSSLTLHPGADEVTVARVEAELGWRMPGDYRALLAASNGVYGCLACGSYVHLWRVEDLPMWNRINGERYYKDLFMIGGDGGGEGLAYRCASDGLVMIPLVGDINEAVFAAATLDEFLRHGWPAL